MNTIVMANYRRNDIISKVAVVLRDEKTTATDIESAVDRAGIDRDEVYATFGSMHGLILEMVSDLSGLLIQPLEDHSTNREVRDVLVEFGNLLADAYSASHLDVLYRIALNEATRYSWIAREVFERGHGKLTNCLAQYLEYSAKRCNQILVGDPKRFADMFLSLLGENLESSSAKTSTESAYSRPRTAAVTEAVDHFCHCIITGARS